MEKINTYDVFYSMLLERENFFKNRTEDQEFYITIDDLRKRFNASYHTIYAHIQTLLEKELIVEKEKGFIPKVDKLFIRNIFYVYDECRKKQITPNNLLNNKAVEIIQRGLGKKNLVLKDIYSDINSRTLKKYFSLFLKNNFVLMGSSDKPQTFDFNDDLLLRVVLKIFGKIPDIDVKKEEKTIDTSKVKIEKIVMELKLIDKYRNTKENKFESLNYEQKLHFITHTTSLEGNTMSFEEVKALLEEGKILGNPDITDLDENRNMKRALEFVESKLSDFSLTLDDIKRIHYIILENIKKKEYEKKGGWEGVAGIIRNYPVYIKNNPKFVMCNVKELDSKLKNYETKFNQELTRLGTLTQINTSNIEEKIKFITWVHSEFQHIHPFGDGNSRTTRLLFTYALLSLDFPMIDIYDSYEYVKHTKKEEKRNDVELFSFFVSLIYDNLKKMNLKLK